MFDVNFHHFPQHEWSGILVYCGPQDLLTDPFWLLFSLAGAREVWICQKDGKMLFTGLTNDKMLRQSRYAAAIRNICKAANAEPRAPAMSRSGTTANWTI